MKTAPVGLYERSGSTTTVVSKGSINGNGAFDATYVGASTDGSRIFFETAEQLVAADGDTVADVYERSGGQTTLVSVGPSGNGLQVAHFAGATPDGTHVFFTTDDALDNDDLDTAADIYERSGSTTTLVSTGLDGAGNNNTPVSFGGVTPDGAHVFFNTNESLVPADQNSSSDVYEHAGGQTTLVSTSQDEGHLAGGGSIFSKASTDGSKVVFQSGLPLVKTDHDALLDVYEHDGGNTYLVSTIQPQTFPAAPTLSSFDPASPANVTFLSVRGSAPGGTTVKLYDNGGCTGAPVATGSAAEFASPGLVVHAGQDATTTFRATATDANGYASPCSSSSLTFVEDSTAPPAPAISGTTPASPANDNDPQIAGTAEAGSTVRLYSTADCTGSPLATGSAAEFAAPGLTIVVLDDSTTSLRATATDAAGNASGCSDAATYVEDTPDAAPVFQQQTPLTPPTLTPTGGPSAATDTTAPETKIGGGPKTRTTSRTAAFRFTASEAGASFRCRLDKQRFSACRSPKTYKGLKPGKHTFYVVAVDAAGNADATPATKSFRVVKKR